MFDFCQFCCYRAEVRRERPCRNFALKLLCCISKKDIPLFTYDNSFLGEKSCLMTNIKVLRFVYLSRVKKSTVKIKIF